MKRIIPVMFALLVTACSETSETETPVFETPVTGRWYTAEQVMAGKPLYETYCAVCHAADGSATAEWRTPLPDGNYPPPPLNGTAHTWHHPLDMLNHTIAKGGAEYGGVMPGFEAAIDESGRLAIIAWFQSLWSDEIYEKWQKIDERSKE